MLARLVRLEECRQQLVPRIFRYGWVRALPQEFIGERHLVIVKQRATANLNVEWCQFEERPGCTDIVPLEDFQGAGIRV